ncbi:hypothetical protein [Geomicrobium sp. JCM 19039]|nr:hypothetical protein [Geomicrobium sp. JCM 19039]
MDDRDGSLRVSACILSVEIHLVADRCSSLQGLRATRKTSAEG